MELEYESRELAPKEVRLECERGRHTLTFQLSPTWMVVVSVGSMWAMAATLLGFIAWFIRMFLELPPAFRPPLPANPLRLVITWIVFSLFLCLGGLLTLLSYRRRGHIPRYLWIDADKRTLGHRRERSNRREEFPLGDVQVIRMKKINSFGGTVVGEVLAIRLRGRGPSLTFRFAVEDERTLHDFTTAFIALVPAAKVRWVSKPHGK